ncbi:hypothetical protein [Amycolatopsis sp. DSM 110486]|uniref:hypothetical protein n=1 Tax=Amycolatopsis sp. DSM 110486 TaxID=2865832 RepID=UPI001C695FAB|nr:hypothetical protein [Amycolatopsis sp. DSM 110486]QYN24996.1 hypothetical protein K1T34_22720 [Amycolatopsis sp. DSM 110486]
MSCSLPALPLPLRSKSKLATVSPRITVTWPEASGAGTGRRFEYAWTGPSVMLAGAPANAAGVSATGGTYAGCDTATARLSCSVPSFDSRA